MWTSPMLILTTILHFEFNLALAVVTGSRRYILQDKTLEGNISDTETLADQKSCLIKSHKLDLP